MKNNKQNKQVNKIESTGKRAEKPLNTNDEDESNSTTYDEISSDFEFD